MSLNEATPELHDARLDGVSLDPVGRTAEIRIAYYPHDTSASRVPASIRFSGVRQFHQLVDLELLEAHRSAGNVTQWITGERPGLTEIYLARGLISVTADSVWFVAGD